MMFKFGNLKSFARNPFTIGNAIVIGIGFTLYDVSISVARDIVLPFLEYITTGKRWVDIFYAFDGGSYPTLADAELAGAPTLNYGLLIFYVVQFFVVLLFFYALYVFLIKDSEQFGELSSDVGDADVEQTKK